MAVQTVNSDHDNRYGRGKSELENELRSIWLGIMNRLQTFADLDEVKDKPTEIRAIRQLIDEGDDETGAKTC
jgi:hypothetical protein